MLRTAFGVTSAVLTALLLDGNCRADGPTAAVSGRVVVRGEPPAPRVWDLEEAMRKVTGRKTYTDQTWRVGAKGGLANCVVTLRAKDPAARPAPKPLPKATLEKVGCGFSPRVMVVTAGTRLTFQNRDSPCKGFQAQGAGQEMNRFVPVGSKVELGMPKRGVCRIGCPLRPYMVGWVHVTDTPYYAVTDANGHFTIPEVAPGEYRVAVWHEAAGKLSLAAKQAEVSVGTRGRQALRFTIPVGGKE